MSTWLITGANRGIGLEFARQIAARGDEVIAVCRTRSQELSSLNVYVVDGIDVTSDKAASTIEAALGSRRIDVLVHNAGLLVPDDLDSFDVESIRKQYEVNAIAPLRLTRALLPRLGRGSKVALVSSRAGSIGDNGSGGLYGYRMSKAALNMAGVSLGRDLAPKGIFVALLHPGFIGNATVRSPWTRRSEPTERCSPRAMRRAQPSRTCAQCRRCLAAQTTESSAQAPKRKSGRRRVHLFSASPSPLQRSI